VRYQTARIDRAVDLLEPGCAVVATHACGPLTDRCIDRALEAGSPVAVMPCCYPQRACPGPAALQQALGTELAFDIDRTYRLEGAGYRVRWSAVSREITPMNRILVGIPPSQTKGEGKDS
jgi:hypothetical protein